MFKFLLGCAVLAQGAFAFGGPFVFWGIEPLKHVHVGALQRLNEDTLHRIYGKAEAVVVFVRNASSVAVTTDTYPSFTALLMRHPWSYLAQDTLAIEPEDINTNTEVINLVGSPAQQDIEISALFNDAVNTYGVGKVLGILATDVPKVLLFQRARRAVEVPDEKLTGSTPTPSSETASASTTTEEPQSPPEAPGGGGGGADEPMQENFVYIDAGKTMMFTTGAPVLSDGEVSTELRSHGITTTDERKDELVRFIISFKVNRTANNEARKVILRFRFPISRGYWYLTSVELEENSKRTELEVVGEAPSAPIGFSYKCSSELKFRHANTSTTLKLVNIQVQPLLGDQQRQFSDAWHCVGFMTAPIGSGILVVSLLIGVMLFGFGMLANIKTPTKFENSRGKQLTFTIQE